MPWGWVALGWTGLATVVGILIGKGIKLADKKAAMAPRVVGVCSHDGIAGVCCRAR